MNKSNPEPPQAILKQYQFQPIEYQLSRKKTNPKQKGQVNK
jgi:hypothetical protein